VDGRVVSSEVVRAHHVGILIFKGFTARRLYKSFGVKGLMNNERVLTFLRNFVLY
jgi:hypothetical protein